MAVVITVAAGVGIDPAYRPELSRLTQQRDAAGFWPGGILRWCVR